MDYECILVTTNVVDELKILDEIDTEFFIDVHYLDTAKGKKSGWKILNEFGATKTPFICVKHGNTVVKCFYSESSDTVIDDFINWHYFNNMENTEVLSQVEQYLKKPVDVPIVNMGTCKLPSYATKGSAGADLRAYLKEAVEIKPGERKLIPTGLHMNIPVGFELQVRPRSGLALKSGITVLNTPGTVDSDFTGDIGIILFNTSDKPFTVNPGDKIAQGILSRVYQMNFIEVESLEETERGSGGYGHSGIK